MVMGGVNEARMSIDHLDVSSCEVIGGGFVPFSASSTLIDPPEGAASPATSTSSAAATGEVGSSPSD